MPLVRVERPGNDTLLGEAGNDTLEGGIGTVLTNDVNTVVELYYPEDDANLAELREALH